VSATPPFERSVFINCPFDDAFAPILQAIAFCVTDLGFHPRLAPENADNAASRLDRIIALIHGSQYGIHDLSRCKAVAAGDFARMNMPFELGIDHGARRFGKGRHRQKAILILEHTRFDYQRTLSDIAGWDIGAHDGDHIKAVREVRNWLVRQAGAERIGADRILKNYVVFQTWYWQRETARGASEDDIRTYPTVEVVTAMRQWIEDGRPS
jgi:hypothetical protein